MASIWYWPFSWLSSERKNFFQLSDEMWIRLAVVLERWTAVSLAFVSSSEALVSSGGSVVWPVAPGAAEVDGTGLSLLFVPSSMAGVAERDRLNGLNIDMMSLI